MRVAMKLYDCLWRIGWSAVYKDVVVVEWVMLKGSLKSAVRYHQELQIGGDIEDNSKMIFLIFQQKHML